MTSHSGDLGTPAVPATALPTTATAGRIGPVSSRRALPAARRLVVADTFAAIAVLVVVALPATRPTEGSGHALLAALAFVVASVGGARVLGLHDTGRRIDHSIVDDVPRLILLATAASWVYLVAGGLLSVPRLGAKTELVFWAASFALFLAARVVVRTVYRLDADSAQPTLVVGAGDVGQLSARKLQHHPEYGLRLEGLIDDRPRPRRADLDDMTLLGSLDELPAVVEERGIQRVVVAFSDAPTPRVLELVRGLIARGVHVDLVPRLFQAITPDAALDSVEGLPLVSLRPRTRSRTYVCAKRAVDVVGALAGLILTAPLLLFIAWRIKRDSPGPILFRQRRWGMHMREFTSLKFRTMRLGTPPDDHRDYIRATASGRPARPEGGLFKLERRDAVTDVGRWLRRTSLDELPQLINVLRGDMSLVGPRPCIPYEAEYFAPHHFERFSVPQGLTGLWQVTARAHATFAEALDIDVAYARSCSFWLDLKLVLRTPLQMIGVGATR
jgi:exopolysaccharide biosynthesis polyprenyl glycosylphosphotransferase